MSIKEALLCSFVLILKYDLCFVWWIWDIILLCLCVHQATWQWGPLVPARRPQPCEACHCTAVSSSFLSHNRAKLPAQGPSRSWHVRDHPLMLRQQYQCYQYFCSEVIKLAQPPCGDPPDCLWFQCYQSWGGYQGRQAQTGGGWTLCLQSCHSEGQCWQGLGSCQPPVWWGWRDSDIQTEVYLVSRLGDLTTLFILESFISWTERPVLPILKKLLSPSPTFHYSLWPTKLGKNWIKVSIN